MLNCYLKPEKLDGDNKYHCEKCASLQEAVKTVNILETPQHLKCILMR
jgi:ubiquitin carboxyl-terminal hydrolase 35/38